MTAPKAKGMGGFEDIRHSAASNNVRTYGAALLAAAEADERIVCLGADLTKPTQTVAFRDALPERFFNMGIQEANMVGAAGGMARTGDIPFAHSFCVFITRRVYDQVAMQVAYPNLPVKLVGFIPGISTELGVSHQAIDDIALMRALPNMAVIEPSGSEQVGSVLVAVLAHNGPVYLRMALCESLPDENIPLQPFALGRGNVLRQGRDIAIFAIGEMVSEANKAADILAEQGISATLINMASIKPLDRDLVLHAAKTHRAILTAENHSVIGGLGAAVAETIALAGVSARFAMIGIQDVFAEGGSMAFLLKKYGTSADHIVAKCGDLLGR
ncbi:transketolase family protein [Bradyrhizobium vignae]|uniref:Transketolase n=1 Tax=Bradyrhizobium vignae TaxID=1549949 RepID=A0ABS4A1V3_9BRAD|nr:transketolase C-terminal domain-containing protein [Bradyrhizobium vignae]MBP0114392.1 transketolase [Bradyrhizobium vignae]